MANPFLTPESNFQGCDIDACWQFVPYFRDSNDQRYLRLSNPALKIKVANEQIVEATLATPKWGGAFRTLTLRGRAEGVTTIDVILPGSDGDTVLQTWTIEVGYEIEIPVQYHILKGLFQGSAQTPASVALVIAAANTVLRPQANLSITAQSGDTIRRVAYSKPFISPSSVDPKDELRRAQNQLALLMHDVRHDPLYFHIFFVKDTIPGSVSGGIINGFHAGSAPRGTMLLKDRADPTTMGRTLAHEFAHAKDVEHSSATQARKDVLMWGTKSPSDANPGEYLNRQEIETLRKMRVYKPV